jgi:glyoxylase-like metal-dependent hydrolase (beta-lactamase superfamily II)
MIEISRFEEVTQIKMSREVGGRALYWVAAYLVDGLLIDTGCKYTAEELANFLEGQELKWAVNTHHHEDHIGANHLLKRRFGIEIFAHREAIPLINQIPKLYPYQEMVWGYPEPTEVAPLPDTIETDHLRFDVIETPGHCNGHVVLVEPEKGWCFSGDLFVSESPKVLRPEENVSEYIRSMRKLGELETERLILFTSIGKIVQDGRKALRSCIEYFEDLSRRAQDLERRGLSLAAIRDELLGGESHFAQLTGGHYSSENLIRAALRAQP